MSIPTLNGLPQSFEQGDTLIFTDEFEDYPATTWEAFLILGRNGSTPIRVNAAASGTTFLFTLTSAASAEIAPGWWDFAIYVTADGQRATARTGTVAVRDNLAVVQPLTPTQVMLAALEKAITDISSSAHSSGSWNGQSWTNADMGTLMAKRVQLQAEIIREQDRLKALRGTRESGFIATRYLPHGGQVGGVLADWTRP